MYSDFNEEIDENNITEENNGDREKIKRIVFFISVFVVLLVLVIVFVKSCDNKEENKPSEQEILPSVTLDLTNISLKSGETMKLNADVIGVSDDKQNLEWQSEDSSIADVSNDGVVNGISEGTTKIVVIYKNGDKIYTNSCDVTVTSNEITVEKIDIQQDSVEISKGEKLLLQVSVEPIDAKIDDLIFSTDNPSVATVDEDGNINAIDVGTTTITVKEKKSNVSDSITVVVTKSGSTVIQPISLELSSLKETLSIGSSVKVNYTILPTNANDTKITWISTDPSVVKVIDGILYGVSAGKCVIVASTNNNISAQLEVTVEPDTVNVDSISFNDGNTLEITQDGTKKLSYSISPANATNQNVTFKSEDSSVVTVDSNGLIKGVKEGISIITVTTDDGNKKASIIVTVNKSNNNSSDEPNDTDDDNETEEDNNNDDNDNNDDDNDSGGGGSSCSVSASNMVTVESDTKSVSSDTKTPRWVKGPITVTITKVSNCIEKLTYKGNSIEKGDTFKLTSAGSNSFVIKGTTVDGKSLEKNYYYRIDATPPIVNIDITGTISSLNTVVISSTAIDSGSGVNKFRYCYSTDSNTCTPTTVVSGTSFNKSFSSSIKSVCVNAIDNVGNVSTRKCKLIS